MLEEISLEEFQKNYPTPIKECVRDVSKESSHSTMTDAGIESMTQNNRNADRNFVSSLNTSLLTLTSVTQRS